MTPKPPLFVTSAANSGPAATFMPANIIGRSMPNSSVIAVEMLSLIFVRRKVFVFAVSDRSGCVRGWVNPVHCASSTNLLIHPIILHATTTTTTIYIFSSSLLLSSSRMASSFSKLYSNSVYSLYILTSRLCLIIMMPKIFPINCLCSSLCSSLPYYYNRCKNTIIIYYYTILN